MELEGVDVVCIECFCLLLLSSGSPSEFASVQPILLRGVCHTALPLNIALPRSSDEYSSVV